MSDNATYFIKLKSLSNQACETQTITKANDSTPEFVARVQAVARGWGRGNGSTAVQVSVETYGGECVVSAHAFAIPAPPVVRFDEDEQPVTITITKAQARLVLAGLSERNDTLQKLYDFECQQGQLSGAVRSEALVRETKATYQSIDKQVYG